MTIAQQRGEKAVEVGDAEVGGADVGGAEVADAEVAGADVGGAEVGAGDAVLRDCVQALVGLAYRTPGFDMQVSDGGRRSVRLQHVGGGLAAQLLLDGQGAERGPVGLSPSPASFVAELEAVLAGSTGR